MFLFLIRCKYAEKNRNSKGPIKIFFNNPNYLTFLNIFKPVYMIKGLELSDNYK